MGLEFKIEGLEATLKGLEEYSKQVQEGVKEVVKETTINIESKAKQKVPVKSGALKRSITHEFKDDGFIGEIGSDLPYAPSIEYGTYKQSAQPYLTPSLEEEVSNFIENLKKIL